MKRSLHWMALLPVISIALANAGCQKALDYATNHETIDFCQIRKISYTSAYEPADSIVFTYNTYGDPVSGIRPQTSTGFTNFLFRYDKLHRMSDQINVYGTEVSAVNPPESWNRYFYDAKGRIAVDTQYFFPDVVNDMPVPGKFGVVSVFDYAYDDHNRISKVTWMQQNKVVSVSTYAYDSTGNLAGLQYDKKINFHRCNKIWMFLARDYSTNNPLIADYTYNRIGLPLTINCIGENSEELMNEMMGTVSFDQAAIEYSCH